MLKTYKVLVPVGTIARRKVKHDFSGEAFSYYFILVYSSPIQYTYSAKIHRVHV